jgi:hypothetical protein
MNKSKIIKLEVIKCCYNCKYFATHYWIAGKVIDTYCIKRGLEPSADNICEQHDFVNR